MDPIVYGKDCVLYAKRADNLYYPFACTQEISLTEDTDLTATTTPSSGTFRTFQPGLSTWKLSVAGLLFITADGQKLTGFELFTTTVRRNGLYIKAVFKDINNATHELEGSVLVPSKTLTATAGQLAKQTIELQGSGGYYLDGVLNGTEGSIGGGSPSNTEDVNVYNFSSVSSTVTTVTASAMIGKTALWAFRGMQKFDAIITSGTPTSNQLLFNSTTGQLTWLDPLAPSEVLSVMYKG